MAYMNSKGVGPGSRDAGQIDGHGRGDGQNRPPCDEAGELGEEMLLELAAAAILCFKEFKLSHHTPGPYYLVTIDIFRYTYTYIYIHSLYVYPILATSILGSGLGSWSQGL